MLPDLVVGVSLLGRWPVLKKL